MFLISPLLYDVLSFVKNRPFSSTNYYITPILRSQGDWWTPSGRFETARVSVLLTYPRYQNSKTTNSQNAADGRRYQFAQNRLNQQIAISEIHS